MAETEVPVVLRIFAEKTSSVNSVLEDTKKRFNDLAGNIASVSKSAAMLSGTFTLALGGVVTAAVNVAGQFEQLKVKLLSTLGDGAVAAATFQKSIEMAAQTPFDVQGVVQATVQIAAFGQSTQRVLPLAANLAAAFGERIQDVGLILGKAFSGSLEGFESLRNRLGISSVLLEKFGAELTKTGGISVNTADSLRHAQDALEKIIKTRFGDATEKQAKTLFGALSNLGDAVTRVAAAFGETLIPTITVAARFLTSVVEVFEKLSPETRQFVAVAALTGVALGGIVTAGAGLVSILSAGLGGIIAFKGAIAAFTLAAAPAALAEAAVASGAAKATVEIAKVGVAAAVSAVEVRVMSAAMADLAKQQSVSGLATIAPRASAASLAMTGLNTAANAWNGANIAGSGAGIAGSIGAISAPAGEASTALAVLGESATAAGTGAGATEAAFGSLLGPVAAVAVVFGGIAMIGIKNYTTACEKADVATIEQARTLVEARNALRDYVDTIEKVTNAQGKLAGGSGSISAMAQKIRDSFKNVTPIEMIRNMEKYGITLESLGKDHEKNAIKTQFLREKYEEFNTVQARVQATFAAAQGQDTVGVGDPEAVKLMNELLGTTDWTLEDVAKRGDGLKLSLDNMIKAGLGINMLTEQFSKFSPILDKNSKDMERFGVYMKYATKSEDPESLANTFKQVSAEVERAKGVLNGMGIATKSIIDLQKRLLDPALGLSERDNIEKLLGLIDQKEGVEKKQAAGRKKELDEYFRSEEAGIERSTILRGEDKKAQIEIYSGLLLLTEKGSAEELSILRKLAAAKQGLKREEVANAKNSLAELSGSATAGMEKLRATGEATAVQTAAALQVVLVSLEAWRVKNAALLAQQPALRKEFASVVAGFTSKLDTANLDKPKEALQSAIIAAKDFGTEAVTNVQKLEATHSALALLINLQESGQITGKQNKVALQNEINRLTKDELTLQASVTKEADAQTKATAGVRREGLNQELEILKAQQEVQGKTPFLQQQIADKEKEILAGKIAAIRDAAQAELSANPDAEAAIRERTEMKITGLKADETLKRIKLEQDQTKAVEDEAKKQEAIRAGFAANRLGGKNSPIISLGELSATSNLLPNFGFDAFGASKLTKSGGPPSGQLSRVRAGVERDILAGESLGKDTKAQGGFTGGAGGAASSTSNFTYNLALSGGKVRPEDEPAIRAIIDKYLSDKKHSGEAA